MAFVRLTACGLLLAIGMAETCLATIIADSTGDYVAGTTAGQTRAQARADGWNFFWSSSSDIGTASKYTSLVWNPTGRGDINGYTAVSDKYPADGDLCWSFIGGSNGSVWQPGMGSQDSSTKLDYYVIAAYTIQSGEAGLVNIANSSIGLTDTQGNGVELRVYVNNELKNSFVQPTGNASNFNQSLGSLKAGDTVYVALGPNTRDWFDWTNVSFQLTSVPEPATGLTSLTGAAIALLAYAWRKRK